ncbi:putative plastid-lipid-associated protein 4, chloroplastic [Morella rubra]|uniref:Putative plastid-lipid-associated protein 4, chloroplastic n=1 Tax=Morella rubra TaxID=262757 RepID=A0A6A1V5A7_9ROSI|nr:putative plastid-lipid-associated protein 4, chloroplastic [Morella rubra]
MALSSHSPSVLPTPQPQSSRPSVPKFLSFPPPLTTFHFPAKPRTHEFSSTSAPEKWRAKVSFFPAFLKKGKDAKTLKEELLEAISPLDRGADATTEDQETVDQIARKLEAVNPVKQPLKSNLLDGKWELLYTTSSSILQTQRPKFLRSSANYQAINLDTLRAQNMESWPFFNQVTANLTPLNARKVAVKFDYFKILGLIPVKAPETARGELETTYLDEELRPGMLSALKEELYAAIAPLDRGAEATPEDQQQCRTEQKIIVLLMARKLETVNEIKEPLKSNLLSGKWELIYTTSQAVLQTQRPKWLRPNGKIYQAINVDTLLELKIWKLGHSLIRLVHDIVQLHGGWRVLRSRVELEFQVTANLVPLNSRRVAVKFDYFRIAGLVVNSGLGVKVFNSVSCGEFTFSQMILYNASQIPIKSPGSGRGQLEITYLDEELRISRGDKGNLFILKMADPSYRVPL